MFKVVVVRQAWVEDGQTKAWFQNRRQRRGRGADLGRSRGDDDVVPGQSGRVVVVEQTWVEAGRTLTETGIQDRR